MPMSDGRKPLATPRAELFAEPEKTASEKALAEGEARSKAAIEGRDAKGRASREL